MSAAAKSSQTVSGGTWHGSGSSVFATAYKRRGDSARVRPTKVSRRTLYCCETRGVHRSLALAETTLSDHVGRTGARMRSPAVDRHRLTLLSESGECPCSVVPARSVAPAELVSSEPRLPSGRGLLDTWLILPVVICLS